MASFVRARPSGWSMADEARAALVEAQRAKVLSDTAATQREPVKFEAGQVVRYSYVGRAQVVLRVDDRDARLGYADRIESTCAVGISRVDEFELLSPAPRHGDTWSNGESVASIVAAGRTEADGAHLLVVSEGEPFVGDVVAVARRLWEGGYRRVEAMEARGPARVKAVHVNGKTMPLKLNDISNVPTYLTLDDLKALGSTHEEATADTLTFEQPFARDPIATALVAQRAGFATVGQMNEARERQVAFNDACRRVAWDFGVSSADADVAIRRLCASLPWSSEQVFAAISAHDDVIWHELRKHFNRVGSKQPPQHVDCRIRCTDLLDSTRTGRTPDVRPLASLANAVAAIFARPDLATSRRYIDQAIASLRGEPFAAAVAAALVAAGDHPLSPHQIAALVRGARAHEARRSEVAPARRTLTDGQLSECFTAGMQASQGEWFVRLSHVYERARTA